MGIPSRKTNENRRVVITRLFILLSVWLTTVTTSAANDVLNISEQNGSFRLAANGKTAQICVSAKEPLSVRKVAQLFADDANGEWKITTTELPTEIECQPRGGFVLVVKF